MLAAQVQLMLLTALVLAEVARDQLALMVLA
jgi:hypothetical protein